MGDLIQFVPRPRTSRPSERAERMIAEARAQYQAIFPDEPGPSALHLPWTSGKPIMTAIFEDTAPCECNPSPENLA